MKKKPSLRPGPSVSNRRTQSSLLKRRNATQDDLFFHAQSFHKAAKTLAATFQPGADLLGNFDACPVVFMYRHAVELHLKAIVIGVGGNFLPTKPDILSVHKTHSVSWLSQFVCQIITAVKWEQEFKCEGVETLSDFKAVIEDLNAVDPGSYVYRLPVSVERQDAIPGANLSILEFARRMDALLELLDSTADALAATRDIRHDILDKWNPSDGQVQ